jgi:hypothetical protein
MPQGTIFIGKSYTIKMPKDSVIASIQRLGYNCDFYKNDSLYIMSHYKGSLMPYNTPYYQTDSIILYFENSVPIDTIVNVKYELREGINPKHTQLFIINVTLTKEGNIQNWKRLKHLSKQYSSKMKDNFIKKVK